MVGMAHHHHDHNGGRGGHGHEHAHNGVDPADFFDERARDWDTPEKVASTHAIAEAIIAAVPLDASWDALEIGCGTGLLSLELGPRLRHVLLTDVSSGMLEVARERAAADPARYAVERRDLSAAPLASPVDLIFASMVLHHVADLDVLLTSLRASLRPGGWIAVADLDADPQNTYHADDFAGHHGIDRDDLQAQLRGLGLVDVAARTATTITKAKDGEDFDHDVFLISGRLPS